MAALELKIWIQLVVWLAIGYGIYFGYGIDHSMENVEKEVLLSKENEANQNNKENEAGEDPEVSGAISWLDLIRNWKEIGESNKKATKP